MTDPLFSRLQVIALSAALGVVCIFGAFPQLDLAISRLFVDAQGQFALARVGPAAAMNDMLKFGLTAFFAVACIVALASSVLRLAPASGADNWYFLAAAFMVGPGLIVNGILKSWVGRARPIHVAEFGGHKVFTPMLQISDQCVSNCSFASGEVAQTSTFVFATLVLAWPRLTRNGRYAACLGGGGLICLSIFLRLALGRHFLSDTLASVAVSAFVVLAAYRVFDVGRARMKITPVALRRDLGAMIAAACSSVSVIAPAVTISFSNAWQWLRGKL